MEELLEVLILFGVLSAIASRKKKKKKTSAAKNSKWEKIEKSLNELMDMQMPSKPVRSDPMGEKTHEGIHPCDEHDTTHLVQMQMDLPPAPVSGSLPDETHEGEHPCPVHNAAPLAAMEPVMPVAEEKPGLQLNWTGDEMVKAFIMQEVLTRPCQRKRA